MSQLFFRPFFILILLLGQFIPIDASPPIHDNFPGAEAIIALPYSTVLDIDEATLQPDEPQHCSPADRTVWYGFVPSGPITVTADTLGSTNTNISIYREIHQEGKFADLELMQCISAGAVTVSMEPGERYFIQVGAIVGENGTVQFSLSDVLAISGRVIDAATGAPLAGYEWPFVWVTLQRVCGESCREEVASIATDSNGRFRFENYSFWGIEPGIYMIRVSANLYPTGHFGPFAFNGGSLALGDLALDPLPKIHSIRGRLLDKTTGKPIPKNFAPVVNLYRCTEQDCSELVNSLKPKSDGRFRFETDSYGNPLPVGTYVVTAEASWYNGVNTQVEVHEGQRQTVGNLRLHSAPVRFSDIVLCPDLPSEGGECVYSLRIWNGLADKFEGDVWGTAYAFLNDSVSGFTHFQIKDTQELVLERGRSKVVQFRLKLPEGKSPSELGLCVYIFVGRGSNSFFNVVASEPLFCILDTPNGFIVSPPQDAKALGAELANEVEPNNSCQTAQGIGAVAAPVVIEGNLNSLQTPDIDFYRFTASAGEPIVIDHEGQAAGKGTLSEPLLGIFDSNCNLITTHISSSNSRTILTAPADGVFILAATAIPDWEFIGGGEGTYRLTVSPLEAIGSIRGRVTDAVTGAPITGDVPFYAYAQLIRCDGVGCTEVKSQSVGSDGTFYFDRDSFDQPLVMGNYMVAVHANQYQYTLSEQFTGIEGEDIDMGDVSITPWPVQITDIQGCVVQSEGGTCKFSVKVTNTLSKRFSGKAWSMIFADMPEPLASDANFWTTMFGTDTPLNIRLAPGASQILRFRFRVRSAVPAGVNICSQVLVGQNPNVFFRPVGQAYLFCLVKGPQGLTLMPPGDAREAYQQIQEKQFRPDQPLAEK